jgi:hypothetical protein
LLVAAGSLITIDFPGAFRTAAFAVNSSGEVVGDYAVTVSESQGGGYLWTAGAFTPIDYPGSKFTRPLGINDAGTVVGWYQIAAGYSPQHGFIRSPTGEMTAFDVPGMEDTSLNGIDDDGNIVGSACAQKGENTKCKGLQHGFVLDASGAVTIVDPPGSLYTEVWSSNGTQAVGRYLGPDGLFHLFLYALDGSGFSYPAVASAGAVEISAEWWSFQGGIDQAGEFVSNYCSAQPCSIFGHPVEWDFTSNVVHGYLFGGGSFTPIDVPGAVITAAFGLEATRPFSSPSRECRRR